jgi:serine protease Do
MTQGRCRSVRISIVAILAIVLLAAIPSPSSAAEAPPALKQLDEAFVRVAEMATPSVVNIKSSKKESSGPMGSDLEPFFRSPPFREFFGGEDFFKKFKKGPRQERGFRAEGMGSGVVVSADGHILTNSHVVKDFDKITVTLSDKRSFDAKVIGADQESDIAVIKIEATGLPVAKFGDSSKLKVGEIVMAVGNPFGFNRTVTSGIISATGRSNVGIIGYEDFIQTDAAINPGNSGGPLVNINGEVIGVNTAIATRSGGYQGIGFAIPVNAAKLIMDDLVKEGKVRRGLLGVNIQDLDESLAKSFGAPGTSGALVSQVIAESAAEKAGIKAGDIILKFNGESVSGAANLKNMVGREKPGATAKLTIYRDKKTFDVDLTIGERTPRSLASEAPSTAGETSNELGVEIEKVPAAMAEKMGLKEGEGVRIKEITNPDGSGNKMGLRVGDVVLEVDGKSVSDVTAFNKAVAEAKSSGLIRLKIQRGSAKVFLASPLS